MDDQSDNTEEEKLVPKPMMESKHLQEALASYFEQEKMPHIEEKKEKKKEKDKERKNEEKSNSNKLCRKDVDKIIEDASLKTMDGCLKILTQLNVRETLEESE